MVATVDDDLKVTQRFFRARSSHQALAREGASGHAGSPSPFEARHKGIGNLRQSIAGSPLSSSVNGRDWSGSPNGGSATAKDRIKAATSVAISPNGKWLVVGETGYKPRVLVFSLAGSSSETSVASVSEHMYGVHCLRFSPDSRYLASLGTVNDGFLYVWSVNDRTGMLDLYASNKLTTLVNCMTWVGKSLITVGLRFVKVWRPDDLADTDTRTRESTPTLLTPKLKHDSIRVSDFGKSIFSPRHKTLQGKNSLLEDLLDCNFVVALPVLDDQAIICAENGEVCILEDVGRTQQLRSAGSVDFPICAARLDKDEKRLLLCGTGGQHKVLVVDRLERDLAGTASSRSRRTTIMPSRPISDPSSVVIATALLDGGIIVEMSLGRGVKLRRASNQTDTVQSRRLPAHMDAVLGVASVSSSVLPTARFLTYSGSGTILFWDETGELVHTIVLASGVATGYDNELKTACISCCGKYLLAGDKTGVVMLVSLTTNTVVHQLRAHAAEILDISTAAIFDTELVATAGRDRIVQLFAKQEDKLDLLQTLDEHAGAVGGVLFDTAQRRLLSYSSDRTIIIREPLLDEELPRSRLAFSIDRTIVLKSSPTALALSPNDQLFVSATDRCIARYRLSDGQCVQTFRCTDDDGGDAVVASKLVHLPGLGGASCIAAACSVDKSVRLYTEQGTLLARDWGHTEGITDIAAFSAGSDASCQDNLRLVSVAADSTMFVWDTTTARQARSYFSNGSDEAVEFIPDIRLDPPMRRVISSTELARFARKKSTTDESKSSSPTSTTTSIRPVSPYRLRHKTSRTSIAQPPKLEPTSDYAHNRSIQRSPSPPSPRSQNRKRESMRRKSMATLRTKSSETVLRDTPALPAPKQAAFGTLAASSESMCRTLRVYRRKLVTSPDSSDQPDSLHELDKELRLTIRALAERTAGKQRGLDESSMNMLLDQASEKLVEMLDGRMKERLEIELSRQSSDVNSLASSTYLSPSIDLSKGSIAEEDGDSLAGALQAVSLSRERSQ